MTRNSIRLRTKGPELKEIAKGYYSARAVKQRERSAEAISDAMKNLDERLVKAAADGNYHLSIKIPFTTLKDAKKAFRARLKNNNVWIYGYGASSLSDTEIVISWSTTARTGKVLSVVGTAIMWAVVSACIVFPLHSFWASFQ